MWYYVVENGIITGKITAQADGRLDATVYRESEVGLAPAWPRLYRDALLTASDWTQLSDAALTAEQIAQAKAYRTTLRNLPAVQTDPVSVVWPAVPEFI